MPPPEPGAAFAPLSETEEFVKPMPYVDLQQLLDEANAAGQFYYDNGTDLVDLSDNLIAVATDEVSVRPFALVVLPSLG